MSSQKYPLKTPTTLIKTNIEVRDEITTKRCLVQPKYSTNSQKARALPSTKQQKI